MNQIKSAPLSDLITKSTVDLIGEPEKPPTILYDWCLLPSGCLFGEWVENHPTLGTGPNCITTKVLYIDELIGLAKTEHTDYILRRKSNNRKEIE